MFGIAGVVAFLSLALARRSIIPGRAFWGIFSRTLIIFACMIFVQMIRPATWRVIAPYATIGIFVPLLIEIVREIRNARRWRAEALRDPIELILPFSGSWRVVAGGAWRATNHHQVASDQRFAYDFIRSDSASLGSPIFSPVTGRVVFAHDGEVDHASSGRVIEDPNPYGNCVAIRNDRGTVFLAHLRSGSVCVQIGDEVVVGTQIGECGNSGRTSGPHLHLHAQIEPEPAPFSATGIPVVFAGDSAPMRLRYGANVCGMVR